MAKHIGFGGGWINDDHMLVSIDYVRSLVSSGLSFEEYGFLLRLICWVHIGCEPSHTFNESSWPRLMNCNKDTFWRLVDSLQKNRLLSVSFSQEKITLTPTPWSPRTDKWSKKNYDEVYERDGNRCRYCSAEKKLTIDHVVPRIRGGSDSAENLVVACRSCNSRKSGRTPEEAGMYLLAVAVK